MSTTLRTRSVWVLCLSFWILGCAHVNGKEAQNARAWTLMIYINGKNNLEQNALDNFHSMASVGSTEKVAIVAQLGRPSARYTEDDGAWSGVYRFLINKGTRPIPGDAVANVVDLRESVDMGGPDALRDFIRWSMKTYPAQKYMVVIWNHGQGWRFQLAKERETRALATSRSAGDATKLDQRARPSVMDGFRAISTDDDTGHVLYNAQVHAVLRDEFKDGTLDLLGFDACLMSMTETAYAFSKIATVMVGSEELEPAAGWRYSAWLDPLVKEPGASAEDVGKLVVKAYEAQYGDEHLTTLSVVRLASFRDTASEISAFADAVRGATPADRKALIEARGDMKSYGQSVHPPLRTSVDLLTLLERFELHSGNGELKAKSSAVRSRVSAHIAANYASERSASTGDRLPYGSRGLAIYFPESKSAFAEDPYKDGYLKIPPPQYPVEFVQNERWADLLYVILNSPDFPP